jgi:hypothetical protein
VVFVKNPDRRDVKTRLSRTLGEDLAREFYLLCLQCLREDLVWITNHSALEVIISPSSREDALWCKGFWGDYPVIPQPLGDLGYRLNTIADYLWQKGSKSVVIIGSDAPTLPPNYILQCYHGLWYHDAILGPTRDGGFYALASRRPIPSLQGINWSNNTTCVEVFQRLISNDFCVNLGPSWYDVDESSDLYLLNKDLKPFSEPRLKLKILVDKLLESIEQSQ